MTTVALVAELAFGARILLQTTVLDTLVSGGAKVVVLTPDPPAIRRLLDARGFREVHVAQLPADAYHREQAASRDLFLRRCRQWAVDAQTVDDIYEMELADTKRRGEDPRKLRATWLVGRLMRRSDIVRRAVVGLENRLRRTRHLDSFFEQHRPDVVVTTSVGTFGSDAYVIREAKARGALVVSYVLSWDNPTVRGLGVGLSDRVIAWSEIMRKELVELHGVRPDRVAVGGVPHYDVYADGTPLTSKAELGKRFGFDPAKRLLLVGTKSPNTYLCNPDVARILCQAAEDGRLPKDVHVLARLHPIYYRREGGRYRFQDDLDEWARLAKEYPERLSVDEPETMDSRIDFLMPDEEIAKLGGLLRASDVVVNMFSTLNLEGSIFDKPILNVGFDLPQRRPRGPKVARFHIAYDEAQTHNRRVIESGGTVVAHTPDELVLEAAAYLADPRRHSEGRRRIVETECGAHVGTAGRRVGSIILDVAQGRNAA